MAQTPNQPTLSLHAFNRAVQRGIPMDPELISYATRCSVLFTIKPQKFSFGEYTIIGALNQTTREPQILTVYRKDTK
jgi:hypothetical protein